MSEKPIIDMENDSPEVEKQQLRVIANFMRRCHGTESFDAAIAWAAKLSINGELGTAAIWERIAQEISEIEAEESTVRPPIQDPT